MSGGSPAPRHTAAWGDGGRRSLPLDLLPEPRGRLAVDRLQRLDGAEIRFTSASVNGATAIGGIFAAGYGAPAGTRARRTPRPAPRPDCGCVTVVAARHLSRVSK